MRELSAAPPVSGNHCGQNSSVQLAHAPSPEGLHQLRAGRRDGTKLAGGFSDASRRGDENDGDYESCGDLNALEDSRRAIPCCCCCCCRTHAHVQQSRKCEMIAPGSFARALGAERGGGGNASGGRNSRRLPGSLRAGRANIEPPARLHGRVGTSKVRQRTWRTNERTERV